MAGTIGNFYLAGVSVEQPFDFLIDVGVLYIIREFFDFHTFVGADFHFGSDGGHGHEGDAVVGKIVHGKLGIAHRRKLLFLLIENGAVILGEENVERIFEKYALAVGVLDDVSRRLSLAETVDRISSLRLDVRLVEGVLPLVCVEFHRDLHRAFFCGFCCVLHNIFLLK